MSMEKNENDTVRSSEEPEINSDNNTALHSTTTEYAEAQVSESSALDIAADGLRIRYIGQLFTNKADWPKHSVDTYIKLALIERSDLDLNDIDGNLDDVSKLTLESGGIDKIPKKKTPLNDMKEIFHYKNYPIPRSILIMGAPGIGKTTLASEICMQWAKKLFLHEDFRIIILIALRTVQNRSIKEVMIEELGESEDAYKELIETSGQKCLIILEGLDEIAAELQQSNQVMEIIKGNALLKATILVTSRPHACQKLYANRRIEIVGFDKEEIKTFVQESFGRKVSDGQFAETFMQQLMEYPHIYSFCYVPITLVMIVDIFKYKKQTLPSTLTELYRHFTLMMLVREQVKLKSEVMNSDVTTKDDDVEKIREMLPDIPNELIRRLLLLSKLAYQSYFEKNPESMGKHDGWRKVSASNPRIIFNEDDLIQCNIKMADGEGLLKGVAINRDSVTYNFIHLTVQEFLCAIHMLTLLQEEQYHILKEYFDDYPNIMILYCGLTKLNFRQIVDPKLKVYSSTVTAMKCLYEDQWNTAPHESQSPFELDMSYITLLPYDCLCLSYVYCHYPIEKLNLYMCYLRNNVGMLAKWCSDQKRTTKLKELDLAENDLNSEGMKHIITIVISSPSLTILEVSENEIGDDGIEACVHHINNVIRLSLEFCGFSVKGSGHLKTILKETKKLQYLHIGKNTVGDDGIKHIAEGLQENSSLLKLKAYQCGFSAKGAESISEMLININHSLLLLHIGSNQIGDKGITAIAKTLYKNKLSKKLNVSDNGITDIGAKELALGLKNNRSIIKLDVQYNDITEEGIIAILEAAISNGVCEVVRVDSKSKSHDKVKEMITTLEKRRRQMKHNRDEQISMVKKEDYNKNTADYKHLQNE